MLLSGAMRYALLFVILNSCCKETVQSLCQNKSIHYNFLSQSDSQQWIISSDTYPLENIYFAFLELNIKSAGLYVYDKNKGLGNSLYQCLNCQFDNNEGGLMPPPFFSSSSEVVVLITGQSSSSFLPSSFTLQFYCILQKLENAEASDSTNNLNFEMTLKMGYGKISPPLIGGKSLKRSTIMTWLIIPQAATGPLIFSLTNLNIPKSSNGKCMAVITIYSSLTTDSSKLFSGCQEPNEWIYVYTQNSRVVYEVFKDNDILNAGGFELTWFIDSSLLGCGALRYPNLLSDNSMLISDGSKSMSDMRRYQSCSWIIQPQSRGKVMLQFHWLNMVKDSIIRVYDGTDDSGVLMWDGIDAYNTVPPPLISSQSTIYVVYTSAISINTNYASLTTNFKGFLGAFLSINKDSYGIGSKSEMLSSSVVIGIRPPGDRVQYFTPNMLYSWYVHPQSISPTGSITFAFGALSFLTNNCSLNRLDIFDGSTTNSPILGSFCGGLVPQRWFITTHTSILMTFRSGNISKGNFELSYFSDGPNYHCGFQSGPNPARMLAPSFILTDGSPASDSLYRSQSCIWVISPPEASHISLFFDYFSLKDASVTIYSGVISDGNYYAKLDDANVVPPPITIRSPLLTVVYTSQSIATGKGFSMTYYATSNVNAFPGNDIVRLISSSILFLSAPVLSTSYILSSANYTWLFLPNTGKDNTFIYISLYYISLGSSHKLSIFDGTSLNTSKTLGVYNISDNFKPPKKWIVTSNPVAVMALQSSNSPQKGDFRLSYYSDGPNINCGMPTGNGVLQSPSMIITDGSSSSEYLYPGQSCIWNIRPSIINGDKLVLEFVANDLLGASLEVYDGSSSSGNLLWECLECSTIPGPIISKLGQFYIVYHSSEKKIRGYGFRAFYWLIKLASAQLNESTGNLLESPQDIEFTNIPDNVTVSWKLEASENRSKLIFSPKLYNSTMDISEESIIDGRRDNDKDFESLNLINTVCGRVISRKPIYLSGRLDRSPRLSSVSIMADQYSSSYIKSSITTKKVYNFDFDLDVSGSPNELIPDTPFRIGNTCKYHIVSSSTQAISINVKSFRSNRLGNMLIYGGIYGSDNILVSALANDVSDKHVIAPCGVATIVLELNSSSVPRHSLHLEYNTIREDHGELCIKYKLSLLPPKIEYDPTVDILIVLATFVICGLCIWAFIFYRRNKHLFTKKVMYKVITPYPPFTPKLDNFRNKFLWSGKCSICQDVASSVFRLKCKHMICIDCLKANLVSALGDISQFPVKCPMHYNGCTGHINAHYSKRVLNHIQYERFKEFSDRVQYGEGMRCIFCYNFVNFPGTSSISMVQCPYCIQTFCLHCKKPWHYGGKCPAAKVDDDLALWTKNSGAQKCPACQKLIEKDGDTCNHMNHKITDGIPCIRDRTDFCYCCGAEVTSSHPHEEIDNPGVDHFPNGVYQTCRVIQKRERDAEIERQRKARRTRAKPKISQGSRQNQKIAALYSEGDEWTGFDV